MQKGNKKFVISPTENLQRLWKEGFFKAWRKFKQVDEHLAKSDYHFGAPELGKALERAAYLTRRGKRGDYEYIQKGPYPKNEQ